MNKQVITYNIIRTLHLAWSAAATPAGLYYYLKNGGASSPSALNELAWLYAMLVIIHCEQYLYPVSLSGALRSTGILFISVCANIAAYDSHVISRGFYITLIAAMLFLCFASICITGALILSRKIHFRFFTGTINSYKDQFLIIGTVIFLTSPFFYGMADFSMPFLNGFSSTESAYAGLIFIVIQAGNSLMQLIRKLAKSEDDYSKMQKELYSNTWKPASNLAFFISMLASFIVLI